MTGLLLSVIYEKQREHELLFVNVHMTWNWRHILIPPKENEQVCNGYFFIWFTNYFSLTDIYMCFLFKQKGIPMTHSQKNKILDTNHKNSYNTENSDNDELYGMEC